MKALCHPLVAEPPHRRHKKSYLSSSSRMTHHQRWVIFMIPESYVTQCLLIAPTHTVTSPIVTNENKGRHVWREKYVSKWLQTHTIHIIRSGVFKKYLLFPIPNLSSFLLLFLFFKGRKIAKDLGKVKRGELRIGTAFHLFLLIGVTNVHYVETTIYGR